MANAFAQINSTWDGSAWSGTNPWATTAGGGTPMTPGTGDVLIANGKTLTIAGNLTADKLANSNLSGATPSGTFTTAGTYAVTAGSMVSSLSACLENTGAGTLTVVVTTLTASSGTEPVIKHSGGGTTIITAVTLNGSSSGNGATCVLNSSASGIVTLTATTLLAPSGFGGAFIHAGTGFSTIVGASISGAGPVASCVYNTSPGGTVVFDGCTITGGVGTGATVLSSGNGAVTKFLQNCTLNASATTPAFACTTSNAVNYISCSEYDHVSGVCAVMAFRRIAGQPVDYVAPVSKAIRRSLNGSSTYYWYFTVDNASSQSQQAAVTDVRFGVVYGPSGTLTGTCKVPEPGSCALGVPVDNTYGTAILTFSGIWNQASSSLNVPGSIGMLLAGLSSPTANAIALQVRAELATELARLDAAVTSRLATAGYTAPLNPANSAVASAVRTELAIELGRIDAAVSTAGNPTAIARSVRTELAGELARVSNCATVESTGAQLAAF